MEEREVCPSHSFKRILIILREHACSRFLTGCCEKISHRGRNLGNRGKFALASGEEANNREKAREVYCPKHY